MGTAWSRAGRRQRGEGHAGASCRWARSVGHVGGGDGMARGRWAPQGSTTENGGVSYTLSAPWRAEMSIRKLRVAQVGRWPAEQVMGVEVRSTRSCWTTDSGCLSPRPEGRAGQERSEHAQARASPGQGREEGAWRRQGAQEDASGRTMSRAVGAESTGPGHGAVTGQLVTVSVASGGGGNLL